MSQLRDREEQKGEGRPCGRAVRSVIPTLTTFHTSQNPKRRVLPSNSSVSSVAGWTLPTSSSVPSASVPWLVQKGEWPQPTAVPSPVPEESTIVPVFSVFSRSPPCAALGVAYPAPCVLGLPGHSVMALIHQGTLEQVRERAAQNPGEEAALCPGWPSWVPRALVPSPCPSPQWKPSPRSYA